MVNHTVSLSCDFPNADINRFTGKMDIKLAELKTINELNHKNLLLRGTKVKNTEWVVGFTVYTGKNTKIMQNGCNAAPKTSNIERKVNKIIVLIIFFELLCCACSTVYCYVTCLQTTVF